MVIAYPFQPAAPVHASVAEYKRSAMLLEEVCGVLAVWYSLLVTITQEGLTTLEETLMAEVWACL